MARRRIQAGQRAPFRKVPPEATLRRSKVPLALLGGAMDCPACGSENEAARKFRGECGSPLAQICPSCGEPNAPAVKFCGECGAQLDGGRGSGVVVQVDRAYADTWGRVSLQLSDLVRLTGLSHCWSCPQ